MESSNLRDFLRVKEDDDRRNSLTGLTISAVLREEKRTTRAQVNRTLLDIIRDDPTGGIKDSKINWKVLRDKLRLRRAGAAWTSAVPIPASDVPISNPNRAISRRSSTRVSTTYATNSDDPGTESTHPDLNSVPSSRAMMMRRNSIRIPSLATSRYGRGTDELTPSTQVEGNARETMHRPQVRFQLGDEDEEEEAEESEGETEDQAEEGGEQQPARTSLMALLTETDREMGLDGSSFFMDDDEEEEEEERRGGEYNSCCVCMVRHKGAAFIPCGHTFCRLCSRELWVQRGNCPICNRFILEILDIF